MYGRVRKCRTLPQEDLLMSWEPENADRERRHTEAVDGEAEATQPESGRKGGAVIAARGPAFAGVAREREWAETPATAHRTGLTNWGAALLAGVAAGVILLGAELLLAPLLYGANVWEPVRLMASVVAGERALEPPLTFEPGLTLVALLVHFAACVAFAVILAPLLRWFERGPAALMGAAYGLLTYNLVFYAAAMVRPTLIYGRGTPSIIAHVLFGVALAVLYRTFAGPPEAPIPEPPTAEISRSETVLSG